MVDVISTASGTVGDLRVASSTRATAPAAPVVAAKPAAVTGDAPPLAQLAKAVAAEAPVDADRVRAIRDAVQNGTFPILPATIADQMLAFRYEWMSHDAS